MAAGGLVVGVATGTALAGGAPATATDAVPCIEGEDRALTCTGAGLGAASLGFAGVGIWADSFARFGAAETVGTVFDWSALGVGAAGTGVDTYGLVKDLTSDDANHGDGVADAQNQGRSPDYGPC